MSTSVEKRHALSVLRNSTKPVTEGNTISTVSSSCAIPQRVTQSGRRSSRWRPSRLRASVMHPSFSLRAGERWLAASSHDRAGTANLPLKLKDAVDERLSRRRTPRHIDVDGHDTVAAAHHRVAVVIVAPAIGAGAHRDHV